MSNPIASETERKIYTIVAYKSDGQDICRNCVMDSFSSDFGYISTDSEDRAVEFVAEKLTKNELKRRGEGSFELYYFVGGKEVWPSDIEELLTKATRLSAGNVLAFKAEQAAEEKRDAVNSARRQEALERKKLAELKAKFEGGI